MIGSLGAGLTLAIASSVALLLVSSVVAFKGWPGAPAEPSVDNVAKLTDGGTVAPKASSGTRVASLQLPAAAVSARRSRHSVSGVRRSAASSAAGTGAEQASTTSTPPSASAPSSSSFSAPATHESTVHHAVSQTGQHAADAVTQTTDAAAKVVAPVAPPAASTLEQLGAAGSNTVQQVTTTAGNVLGG
jgi:hypothetical protein